MAATAGIADLIGYERHEVVGRRIEDMAAAELAAATSALWEQFQRAGRDAKAFAFRHRDRSTIHVECQAEADFPVPGLHVARMRPVAANG